MNHFFGEVTGERIIWSWRPNIWLPESMVRSTKIWRHWIAYVHAIIYVGFCVNPWYWKYTQTQARRQAPIERKKKNMDKSEGGGFSKSEAIP